jgi:PAS domain S-box-containing protein
MDSELSNTRGRLGVVSGGPGLPVQLQATADSWQAAFDAMQDVLLLLDTEYRIRRANAAAVTFFGRPLEQLLGSSCPALLQGADTPLEEAPAQKALQTRQHAETESFHTPSKTWLLVTADPVQDAAGHVTGLALMARNINRRKHAEEALRSSYAEIEKLKDRLQAESDYLKAEMTVAQIPGQVMAESSQMQEVLHLVEQVAPTNSSVLLTGETGTGKELIAESIHALSPRKQRLMVKVNCAALPSALIESELFGRERGAYTGAMTRQAGRFEVADGSTIFLDEIAELSHEVQAKLLRVLQEGQFERLGNPKPLRVDVRVVAATNRNLSEEVRKGRFREDLFYRLNVFPIKVPPLRERVEDLPLLVWAFVEEFSSRMGKRITKIPRRTMSALQHYRWPGNVRELRNIIEHGVIISPGEILRVPPLEDPAGTAPAALTLAEAEREHILQALELTGWRIKGPRGAASRLGLKASTLYTRMQKHGIPTRRQKDETFLNAAQQHPNATPHRS